MKAVFITIVAAIVGVVISVMSHSTSPTAATNMTEDEAGKRCNLYHQDEPFWHCVTRFVGRPMTELETRKDAAEEEYNRCVDVREPASARLPRWKRPLNMAVQSYCMAQVYPTCNAAHYDPKTCLIPQPR
jgi:hypothetical protein